MGNYRRYCIRAPYRACAAVQADSYYDLVVRRI